MILLNYTLLALLLVALALSVSLVGIVYQKISFLKMATSAIAFLFTGYILISGFYFWVERFDFFHVLITECVILAVFCGLLIIKKKLGLSAMQQVQSAFFICAALFVLFTTENLKLKKASQFLAVSIVVFCPFVQWVTKSALTEGFLTLIIAWFLYCVTDRENRASGFISTLPVCAFCFWHVSAFTLMPLFVVIYVISYEETKDPIHIAAGATSLIAFPIGTAMMMFVQPVYTGNNIRSGLVFIDSIGREKILPIFLCASVICILLLLLLRQNFFDRLYQTIKKDLVFKWLIRGVLVLVAAAIGMYFLQMANGLSQSTPEYYGSGVQSLRHLTIFAFVTGTGFVALPAATIRIFFFPNKLKETHNALIVAAMFFYCVLLMAAFLRKEIPYYYYYARYLAPFIVTCAIGIGLMLDSLHHRAVAAVAVFGIVSLLPFNFALFSGKDASRMEWDVLTDIAACIKEDSAVIIDGGNSFLRLVMLPVKAMTGADVYPVSGDRNEQLSLLKENYQHLYALSSKINADTDLGELVYVNRYSTSEDTGTRTEALTLFPLGFEVKEQIISLLRCYDVELEYDFSDNSVSFNGLGAVENNRFRWIEGSEAGFSAYLQQDDYLMEITPGAVVPLGALKMDSLEIGVEVNNVLVQKFSITRENANQTYEIAIPKGYLTEGKNRISFHGETWSPADYGSNDKRELLFSINHISFKEMN